MSAALDAYERYHAIVTETGYDPKAAPLDPIEQRVREIRIHLERLRMLGVREIAERCAELHAALNPTGLGRTISTVQDQQRNFVSAQLHGQRDEHNARQEQLMAQIRGQMHAI